MESKKMRDRVAWNRCGQPDLWPNSSETAPLTSNLPPSAAKRSWLCVTTDVDFNRAMSTDREADNPCAPRYHCDRQLRRPPPDTSPARLSRNPFATGQTLILFLLESIQLNAAISFSPRFSFPDSISPSFFFFLRLFFSLHLIYLLIFSYVFPIFFPHFLPLLFVPFLSLSRLYIRHEKGVKWFFGTRYVIEFRATRPPFYSFFFSTESSGVEAGKRGHSIGLFGSS